MQDVYDLWQKHDAEQEEKLSKLPICSCCKERIQQESAIHYNNKWWCEECEDEFWQSIRKDFLKEVS